MPSNKYISIGETTLFKSSGLAVDKAELGEDGTRIITKDNTVYLMGGTDHGSLYAVYDFMATTFHYEQYGYDCMTIDKNVKDLKLYNYDVKNIPDIPLRAENYGFLTGDPANDYDKTMLGYRFRMVKSRGEYFMPVYSAFTTQSSVAKSTNTNTYLPYDTYSAEHPDWFSNNCRSGEYQFCYTARGNEEEWKLMTEECAKKIQFSMTVCTPETNPEMNVITLTMEDNFQTCTCEKCMELKEEYGTEAGAVVRFMNRVGELVDEWQNKPENAAYRRENFKIIFFAYNSFEQPPVKKNGAGNYEPIDQSVVCRDNVGVYLAIANNFEFQKSLFDDINEVGRAQMEGWNVLSDFIYLWLYETNFYNFMYFYDSFDFFNEDAYRYIVDLKPDMFFAQGQMYDGATGTTWSNLKTYLNAKLSWDSSLNQAELMDNWFNAMYRDAAPEMKKYFYAVRLFNSTVLEKNGFYKLRSNYQKLDIPAYWPLAVLEGWVEACDRAKLAVEKYKTNNVELYRSICNHIEAEAVSPLYMIVKLHGTKISSAYKEQLLVRLRQAVADLNIEKKRVEEGWAAPYFTDELDNL
jgi:hypothetical protein